MPDSSVPLDRWLGIGDEPLPHGKGWWLLPSSRHPRVYLPVERAGWPAALDLISSRKRRFATRLILEASALTRRRPDRRGGNGLLDPWLQEIWPGKRLRHAIYIGTASAFAKDTVQCQDEAGKVLGYVKIPRGPRAAEAIEREAATLETLAREFSDDDFFPRLLGRRDALSLQSPPPAAGPRSNDGCADSAGHILARLAARTTRALAWHESSGRHAIHRALELLGGDAPRRSRLEDSLGRLDHAFAGRALDHCLSHGDFVPWNLRGRFAFDWEWAGERLRWHDAFHFHCYPTILQGARDGVPALEAGWNGAAGHSLRQGISCADGGVSTSRHGMLAYLAVQYAFHVEASLGHGDTLDSFAFLAVMERLMDECR